MQIIYKDRVVHKTTEEQKTLLYILFFLVFLLGVFAGCFYQKANYDIKEHLKAKKKNTLVCYCAGDADCLERCGD